MQIIPLRHCVSWRYLVTIQKKGLLRIESGDEVKIGFNLKDTILEILLNSYHN